MGDDAAMSRLAAAQEDRAGTVQCGRQQVWRREEKDTEGLAGHLKADRRVWEMMGRCHGSGAGSRYCVRSAEGTLQRTSRDRWQGVLGSIHVCWLHGVMVLLMER